jgi:hypothetical protein
MREDLDAEEIGSRDRAPVRFQKGLPGHSLAAKRRWLNTICREDSLDGVSTNLMADIAECPSDPSVTPAMEMWSSTFSNLCEAGGYVKFRCPDQ